jgi:hypothetical protein
MIYFQTKIQIWVNFGGHWNEKKLIYSMAIWNKLRPFGIFYGHLVIKWQFGMISLVFVDCATKNLATLPSNAGANS